MTDSEEPQTSEAQAAGRSNVISREPGFQHFAADDILVLNLGHDLEFAFFRRGGRFVERFLEDGEDEDNFTYRSDRSLAEVARVRMNAASCQYFAFNLLAHIVQDKELDLSAFKTNIDRLYQIAEEARKDPEGDDE